jgi:hypothetical protein
MKYEVCSFEGDLPIPWQQCWGVQFAALEKARANALQQHDALRQEHPGAAFYTLITCTEDGTIIEGLFYGGVLLSGELAKRCFDHLAC